MITQDINLTQRQSEVFYLLAHGFNAHVISEILGISLGTVTNCIRSVKDNLMTTSIHHTVSLLIASGYMPVTMPSLSVMSLLLQKLQQYNPDFSQPYYSSSPSNTSNNIRLQHLLYDDDDDDDEDDED